MYKIGIIGDRATVSGFIALGYSVFTVETAEEAEGTLKKLISECDADPENSYAIIFITEKFAEPNDSVLRKYSERKLPAITVFPETSENGGLNYANRIIKRHVETAVGTDILFRD